MELIGQTILHYKILTQIGEGGMGKVYLAEHTNMSRKVVVKVLLQEFTQNYEIISRFINEAKTLSKLSNPHIVALYDFAEIDSNLFLIMEYIEGIPLNDYISETKESNVLLTLNIFSQILDGFEYAHNQGVIHRDIKPSNIILQKNNTPKILDFGIAKIIQGDVKLTRTGVKMGSILYMSPEQILGEEIDIRTDIYSLGILLYEMLTQKIPYDIKTNSDYEVMDKILKQEIPLININSEDEIGRIIQKACQKNRQDRYQSLSEFKSELDSCSLPLKESAANVTVKTQIINNTTRNISTAKTNNNQQNNFYVSKSNTNRNMVLIFAGLVIVSLLIFLLFNNKDDNNVVEVVSKMPVKETTVKNETDESPIIKDKLITLLSLTEQKNSAIESYYAPNINYYKVGVVSLKTVLSDKRNFFNKWDKIVLTPENINVSKEGSNKYTCVFDKYFKASNYSGKSYDGKVKSRLVFEKVNDNWVITLETDDLIYWTNKN